MKYFLFLFLLFISILKLSAQQTAMLEWANRTGGTGADQARDMAVDAAGNVYSFGYYTGTVDFDPGTGVSNLTAVGSNDMFISKMDANGNLVWAKSLGGSAGDSPMGLAIDPSGNVYITGGFYGTTDFDPGVGVFNMTSGGQSDIYIAKYDVNGDLVWAKEIDGGTWYDHGFDIKLDAAGNIFVVGRFYYQGGPSFDFDPGPGTFLLTAGEEDAFILKLDTDGNFVWARDFGGGSGNENRGYSIDIDAAGNVYTTGYFEATADFDPGAGTFNLTASGDWDVFFSKLDNNGNFVWAKSLVNSAPTYYTDGNYGSKIEVDAAGNIYTSGRFNGTSDFDPGAGTFNLTSNGGFDAYLLKLDTDGNFVWAKSWGSTGYDEGFSLSISATNVFVTGFYANTVDFDPDAPSFNLTSSGGNDIFISQFDINGNFSWARSIGGTGDDRGFGIATNGIGDVYVSGFFTGTADFDPGACTFNQTSAGGNDIFVEKLNQVTVIPLTITSTSPTLGVVGSTVTITGAGFSTIPTMNIVEFNGIVAAVTASTATSITTTVPAGATTGKISVTVNCVTVQSVTDFTVSTPTITIDTQPSDITVCPGGTATFTTAASGTTNITYQWQFSTDGVTFNDIANNTNFSGATTATLSVNTTGNFGEGRYRCRINGDFAPEVISTDEGLFFNTPAICNNQSPVIQSTAGGVPIGGIVTIDLLSLISDPDNNLNLSTLTVITGASQQGAAASINSSNQLVLDYGGVMFSGTDQVTIEVCDLLGVCTQQMLTITVIGEIEIFNAVSPNGDGKNDFFKIQYIDLLEPENTVTIYNRWGSKVFETKNYSDTNSFRGLNQNGNELPSGTYFYKIFLKSSGETKTGYLSLKR
ncbi:MAG: gliding motility-associated C-terminal domain-containing protein [Cyclobacteriaceae bacterium]